MERWRKAVFVRDEVTRVQRLSHELNDGGRKTNQLAIVLGIARELATELVEDGSPVREHHTTSRSRGIGL